MALTDAAALMSAQLRPAGASPPSAMRAKPAPGFADPGEAAFDRWLQRELGRLYDAALEEPVPEDLRRLLEDPAAPPRRHPRQD